MDFRTFVRTLLLHWKLFLGAVLACLAGAAAITAFQTKSYESSATVLISFSGETDLMQVYQGTQAAQERLSSYAAIAGGHAVADKAVAQFHLPVSADQLASQTKVAFTPKTTLFTITVTDTDPQRAAALAKAVADEFTLMVGSLGGNPKPTGAPATTAAPTTSASAAPVADGEQPATQPSETPVASTTSTDPSQTPASGTPVPVARATVVEQPGVPDKPVKPVPVRNMAMGLVAGLLLGTGVALTREAADRTVRDRAKLENLSGLPTLAELPGHRGSAPRFGTDISFDDAVRGLRARLLRAMGPGANRVLLTAPFGGEGTTTTAINLSRAFAELGEDVLLIEGDTRRPVIAGLLKVESGEGLSNALSDPAIATEATKPTSIPKLFVLAARSVRRETLPTSAYVPEVLDRVLADVAKTFERTVVDGPPVLATADSGLLGGAVDATVLVLRAGRTTEDELADALTALRAAGANVVGTVLTDARIARHTRAATKTYRAKVSGPA
ncbi:MULTISPECIES: polysaccharide biosynthesis tyrosine autokinase [Mycobacterium]|uniref:Chain-length determining protein n=1 Tax=Mycobacterium gordonae TaxID=1778 RepID=A0A1X1W648_MYCGO|nr:MULTISPECIES: polysaccharide biosynthesis tyrosine autokinase [Mycobacterium]MCV7009108.1 chain-length determining protein [Mycobacterium gordonae]ODR19273.1 chain-length determining protein [Mycobacterium gordonae]ORV82034.1 chain-length determining protein [Mycobacterium gordonae]PJE10777.1 MAG: chain-length determining protein [Mycobacterium sp.]